MEYTDENRGKPQYDEYIRNVINFDGLRFKNNISPTDIDGGFDIDGILFVYFEAKMEGSTIPYGQSLHLQRLIDSLELAGKEAVLFVCTHNGANERGEIMARDMKVAKVYYKHRMINWNNRTLKESIDSFIEKVQKDFEF